jgi:WD40 repeat protein
VQIWDAASGELRVSLTTSAHVNALNFSCDGTLLVTAQADGNVGVWDHATGRQLGTIATGSGTLYSIAFSGDGRLLATGSNDGVMRLWDFPRVLDSARFK